MSDIFLHMMDSFIVYADRYRLPDEKRVKDNNINIINILLIEQNLFLMWFTLPVLLQQATTMIHVHICRREL